MFLSRGDRDLGVAFQTHPGRQAFISSGSKEMKEGTVLKERSLSSQKDTKHHEAVVAKYHNRGV